MKTQKVSVMAILLCFYLLLDFSFLYPQFAEDEQELMYYNEQNLKKILKRDIGIEVEKIIKLQLVVDKKALEATRKLFDPELENMCVVTFRVHNEGIETETLNYRKDAGWYIHRLQQYDNDYEREEAAKRRINERVEKIYPSIRFKAPLSKKDREDMWKLSQFNYVLEHRLREVQKSKRGSNVAMYIEDFDKNKDGLAQYVGLKDFEEVKSLFEKFNNDPLINEYYLDYKSWRKRAKEYLQKQNARRDQFQNAIHLDKPLKAIKKVIPKYPSIAAKAHIIGEVQIEVLCDINGKILTTRAIKGHPLLRDSACDAVEQWIFEPYNKNVGDKNVVFPITIEFKLEGPSIIEK